MEDNIVMKDNKGVQLLFISEEKIPRWILDQKEDVKVEQKKIGDRQWPVVKIKGAEATFALGGNVYLNLADSRGFTFIIPPLLVLEIRDLNGNLEQRSRFLCSNCFENNGEANIGELGELGAPVYKCSVCGYQWKIR